MGQFWTNHPTLEDTEDWTANVDGKQTATHHRAHLSGRKYSTLSIGRRNRRNRSNQQLRAAHRACLFPFFPSWWCDSIPLTDHI